MSKKSLKLGVALAAGAGAAAVLATKPRGARRVANTIVFASVPGTQRALLRQSALNPSLATKGASSAMREIGVWAASAFSQNAVRTGPGHSVLTCTPARRNSTWMAWENDWTKAFEA